MLVVGIDPGARKTGFAWIRERDKKVTRAVMTIYSSGSDRLRYSSYQSKLSHAFFNLGAQPDAVAIEEPDRREKWIRKAEDIVSMIHLEGIYAVTMAEISRCWPGVRLMPWKTLVWRGTQANKEKTMDRMGRKYNVNFQTDDESDALGIADHAFGLMKRKVSQQAVDLLEPPESPADIKVIAAPAEVELDP